MTKIKETINVKGIHIQVNTDDYINGYISLTDIARYKSNEPKDVIKNLLRNRDKIEFSGLWEILNNNNFKAAE